MGNAIKSVLTETHKKFGTQNHGSRMGKFCNTDILLLSTYTNWDAD